jgi:signal transduction histidine kinase
MKVILPAHRSLTKHGELYHREPDQSESNERPPDSYDRLGSQFLGSISHEFRTPLAAINASVEFLLEELDELSKDELRQLLASIHFSVTSLQTLIDNLLESTNIEAGRFTIRAQVVDLEPVIQDAVQLVRPLLNRREQQLSLNLPPICPRLAADGLRLRQVVVNLVSNASKFGPVAQKIEIGLSDGPPGMVRLFVADRGPGVPPKDRGKLFHRFARMDTQDGAQFGIGLGLWVVRTIIEGHGGQVGLRSRPGGGSIFWCTIPTAKESEE